MLVLWCACAALAAAAHAQAAAGAGPAAAARALAGAARFAVSSSVLLSDAAAAGGELGYRVQATLLLRAQPLPEPGAGALLLHFTLESPKLMLRGKHRNAEFLPKPSLWDSVPNSEFLAVWNEGHITEAYLDPADPPDILDYKKALISLFQFQLEKGERNETDVSGVCRVHYEAVSELVVRKSKMECTWLGARDEDEDGCAERRRVARWELGGGGAGAGGEGLRAISADEVLLLRGADAGHALKARALHTLTRAPGPAPAPVPAPADLAAARRRLPALAPRALPLEPRDDPADDPQEALETALERYGAALESARAGSADAAEATLALLPALRAAPRARLAALLAHPDADPERLAGLALVLGLAAARGAHAAAREALQLGAGEPPRAAIGREYLAALAHAPVADEGVVRDALRLGGGGGALAAPALLAAAAASRAVPEPARARLQAEIKDALTGSLAKCKEESCSAVRLQALGQLRRADAAGLLLEHAERGARGPALAALAALGAGPREGYVGAARRRLERVALALGRPRPLDVRAAALQLALRAGADHPLALLPLTAALRAHGPRELRRVCWLRLRALAESAPALRGLLPRLDPRPRDWARRAHDGTSSVLVRRARWAALDSAQLASGGALRRGAVRLSVDTAAEREHLLTVELWTRGMESFASAPPVPRVAREAEDVAAEGEGEGEGEGEDVEGGLALTVAGVRRPDLTLFSGQGELLGHIWAGAGSEPTRVLRAVLPRALDTHRYALAGGLVLRAEVRRALALAQDAQAQVSLWTRTARAGLELRGAGAELLRLRARTAWGDVTAQARSRLEPALSVSAALDFYAAPQLCVHTALPAYTYSRNVTLESRLGATALRVRRERATALAVPGQTLALGAPNDAVCAALGAAHRD